MNREKSPSELLKISKCQGLTKFAQEQQFQTESSVYQYYQKVGSKQEAYRQKISALQRRLWQILAKRGSEISQARVELSRLSEKESELSFNQKKSTVFWANSFQSSIATVEYFLCKLKDYHQLKSIQIKNHYQDLLKALKEQLEEHRAKRKEMARELEEKFSDLKECKEKTRYWVEQNLISKAAIRQILETISKLCQEYRKALQQQGKKRQMDYSHAKLSIEQLSKILMDCIQSERIKREINKENIVQILERLFRYAKF